ncbi:MAG: response regulator transcription factor [Pseudomonadota bacterium]
MTRNILIVDDDTDLLRQMWTALSREGFNAVVACDGDAGLRLLRSRTRDLVVTDIIMPNREGLETIIQIKQEWPDTKILAISGGMRTAPAEFLKLALLLGADEVLPKPFSLSELSMHVKGLLRDAGEVAQA